MKVRITRSTLFILLLSCVLAISSCKKDEPSDIDLTGSGTTGALSAHSYLSGNLIEANFRGLIRDENDQPLSDVEVKMGNATTSTDADGLWQLLDVMVDSERAYIRAEKDGYFHGSRVLTPTDIGFNRAFITMMTAQTVGSVSSSTGGEVSHSSGSMVSLPTDGFVDENGNSYSGMVDVQMCYLDPSNLDILEQMPGNLTAFEADDDFVALMTYGMIGVELVGSGGESLQIAPGITADIHVVVPSEGLGTAPANIPLWHFDEEEGVWREDGSAELIGNEYVGTVSHFSFWNCDVPADYVFLDGYALGEEAAYPVQGVQIALISSSLGFGSSYTDQEGYFGGFIPANEVLTMEIYSPCGELLSSQEIGPFNSDETIPVIAIVEEQLAFITGLMIDCEGMPTAGHLNVLNGGAIPESIEVSPDGSFAIGIFCTPVDVEVIGYSQNYSTQSISQFISLMPNSLSDIGTLNLCNTQIEEYLSISILGETYVIIDSIWTLFDSQLYIIGDQSSTSELNFITFSFLDSETPTPADFNFGNCWFQVGSLGTYGELNPPSDMNWQFNEYSTSVGEFLEFEFSATYNMIYGPIEFGPTPVSGAGRVQRD